MARPIKEGLEYFNIDTNFDQIDKIAILESIYGTVAIGIIIKLLDKIYSSGYFYTWREREKLLFQNKLYKTDINLDQFIDDCVKHELFDEDLFKNYSILTSIDIQERFFAAIKKRKRITVIKEFLLLDIERVIDRNNLSITSINVDNNASIEIVNYVINSQSKVNKSKVNKSKVKNSKVNNKKINSNDTTITTITDTNNFTNNEIETSEDIKQILNYYIENVTNKTTYSEEDYNLIEQAYKMYPNINFITNTIKSALQNNIEIKGKNTIRTFKYFLPILEDNWSKKYCMGEGNIHESIRSDIKQNLKFDKEQFMYQG